jgi:membrane-bound metal-dependent hydrolase YbcI (DUF457 family)
MASPVLHGWVGTGLAVLLAGDGRLPLFAWFRRAWRLWLGAVVLACLPDIDYLPGLVQGNLNAFHQYSTHSVAWVLLVAGGLWLLGRAWRGARCGARVGAFLVILIGSHLAIDLVTEDRSAPYGLPLAWPVSEARLHAPFDLLPAWEKSTLTELRQVSNLRPLGVEMGAGLLFAAGCATAKRSWTRRRPPL